MKITCEGIYFNKSSIASDDEPFTNLVIEKDVLDRSSGNIIARFDFEIESKSKLVFEVFFDGIKLDEYGTNLPYMETSGKYDTVLFRYPNSAKANRAGVHKIHVKCGLISGIVEASEITEWKEVEAISEADFYIKLNPNKAPRD